MIQSMTGYGKASFENDEISISIEVKSVNSKTLDANIRLPRIFSEKEIEVRNLLAQKVTRGKVSVFIDFQNNTNSTIKKHINLDLLKAYHANLKAAAESIGESNINIFNTALGMPDVMTSEQNEEASDSDWTNTLNTLHKAIDEFVEFRTTEGSKLNEALCSYVDSIEDSLLEIKKNDSARVENVRERISEKLQELKGEIDNNRLEQELIYYIEKLDITEEKVRLDSHLSYFKETLKVDNSGKKLGFIGQEMGREINTIGSKANDASMQKHVVKMKDELEKIKEQVLNVV